MIVALEEDQSLDRILSFLKKEELHFIPPLGSKVNIESYSKKLSSIASNVFACVDGEDIGHAAYYSNDKTQFKGFLSSICISKKRQGYGVGLLLLKHVVDNCIKNGMRKIELEVDDTNLAAIKFYKSYGFVFLHDQPSRMVCEFRQDLLPRK